MPLVVRLSVIPDLLVGFTEALPATTWGGIALMIMHLIVATAGVVPAIEPSCRSSTDQTPAADHRTTVVELSADALTRWGHRHPRPGRWLVRGGRRRDRLGSDPRPP
jgi:hypothetical protein